MYSDEEATRMSSTVQQAYVPVDGENYQPVGPNEPEPEFVPFQEKTIRMAFIRKVYGILMAQLLITTGFITVFVLNEDINDWAQHSPDAKFAFYAALALTFVLVIALACCENVRRTTPLNYICLASFTVMESFMLGIVSSMYKADSVLLAAGVTTVICFAVTVFSFQTKWDFTAMGGALFVLLIVLMLSGIFVIFLPKSRFPTVHIVYACLGALLFSFFLIYDTQLMLGGKHKYAISPEDYVFAALSLYLDIINIFLHILSLLGSKR